MAADKRTPPGDANSDRQPQDGGEDNPIVLLRDGTGRSLACFVEQTLDVDGDDYLLLLPVDSPIEIFVWQSEEDDEEEVLVDVDDADIEVIFPTAKAVLEEHNLALQRSAHTLTASGELPEPKEEDCFTLEVEEDPSGEDLQDEEFQILATFFHEDEEFTICTPLEPLLFFARLNAQGEPELVPPEDFQRLRSQLSDQLFDMLD